MYQKWGNRLQLSANSLPQQDVKTGFGKLNRNSGKLFKFVLFCVEGTDLFSIVFIALPDCGVKERCKMPDCKAAIFGSRSKVRPPADFLKNRLGVWFRCKRRFMRVVPSPLLVNR